MDCASIAFTVMASFPVMPAHSAVITTPPGATAVNTPVVASIVATEVFDDVDMGWDWIVSPLWKLLGDGGGLGKIRMGEDDFVKTGGFGGLNDIDNAAYGLGEAVKGKFANEKLTFQIGGEELLREDENG